MDKLSKIIVIDGIMLEVFGDGRVWQPEQDMIDGRILRERWCGEQSKKDSKRKSYANRKPQYKLIELYPAEGERVRCRVHRLVACAFHGLDYDDLNMHVDHIDCDKSNNRADNLRVVTMEENNRLYIEEQSQPKCSTRQ